MTTKVTPARRILSRQAIAKEAVQRKWMEDAGELVSAHQFAFSALAGVVDRFSGQPIAQPSPEIEGRICLIAQFILGVELCESAISNGLYSQAAALLKQQLETIAAIDEYKGGRRIEKKTPNIKTGPTARLGGAYGAFNNIAHVSRHEIAKSIVLQQSGEVVGANILPVYNRNMAHYLYGQHVYYISLVFHQAVELFEQVYGESMTNEEVESYAAAMVILLQAKVISPPADATGADHDWIRAVAEGRTD
jgi:hypothetical protein